jgi:ribosomal protein S18 acetylase RimI-like enzyme
MGLPSGYTWRPLRVDDLDGLTSLLNRWEDHHDIPFRGDRAEVEQELADPEADLGSLSRCAVDQAGLMRGVGWVHWRLQEGAAKHRAFLEATADPDHVHLEDLLIEWCTAAATALLANIDDGHDRVLRAWSPANVTDRIARFQAHGYHVARYFSTLSRPVAGTPTTVPPDGVTLGAWDEEADGRAIFDTNTEAFTDHWGSVPPDWDTWQRQFVGDSHTRLDLSVVARAGGEVVGFSLNQVWPEDAAVRGLTEVELNRIAVRRAWRRQGIGTSMILESMRRIAAAGFDNATLTVDTESPTGAFDLYKRLGFVEADTDVVLVKEL